MMMRRQGSCRGNDGHAMKIHGASKHDSQNGMHRLKSEARLRLRFESSPSKVIRRVRNVSVFF